MNYPQFNVVEPPQPAAGSELPERTQTRVMKRVTIGPEHFSLIFDPQYPWPTMRKGSEREHAARKRTREQQQNDVERYELTRGVYWGLLDSISPGKRTMTVRDLLTTSTRTTLTRTTNVTETLKETIGTTLGGGAPIKGIEVTAEVRSEFTHELMRSLEISESVEHSTSREHELTDVLETREGVTYLLWRKHAELQLFRVPKGAAEGELVRSTSFGIGGVSIKPVKTNGQEENDDE